MTRTKKILLLLTAMFTLAGTGAMAQDIEITGFKRTTSSEASENPKYDINGAPCGLLRFQVRYPRLVEISPNLGAVKVIRGQGEVKVYVPKGTRKVTISCGDLLPLQNYTFPEVVEAKTTYDITVMTADVPVEKDRVVYIAPGFNVTSIMGPSLAVGFTFNHHNIEAGAVLGLNKSDEIFYYDSNDNMISGYKYKAIRAQLRYGYEIPLTDYFRVVPQVGVAANFITGSDVAGDYASTSNKDYMKSGTSMSGLVALRFLAELSKHFKVHVTPEYDFGIAKNSNCKMINEQNSKVKSWTDGFNLNVGLQIYF